ncbi:FKBP-type peptidyl-prolyl cis-trans isomerase [Streptacidiphilus rugosus]|uniref:FKBP-type peptidyl-prolyl cis-trans isomerase n=1 Tax=Streptacidiphilus rugosus TaxID=405783 RepID=UPI00056727BF|nr:FKBP-type peptidyl-prolyl cis-trans isomerase [Streptacidiphilus rugosus]
MRRRLAAALLLAPALLLTGCGSSSKQASGTASSAAPCPDPSSSAAAAKLPVPAVVNSDSTLPTVAGEFGKSATITVPKGDPDGKFVIKTLSQGTGSTVTSDDVVGFNIVGQTWGGKSFQNSYADGGGAAVNNQHTTPMLPMFSKAVQGQKVGSRVLVVAPPAAGFGNAGYSQLKITCHDTLVMVMDITAGVPYDATAQGDAQTAPADLPTANVKDKAAASFTITAAQKNPKKLGVAVLVKGKGPAVKAGQQLIAQYTGALLSNGSVFDSSWNHGGATSFVIGKGQVIPGWDKALVGQTVGSRVLISIPSADGYGAQGNQGIPANSNLVFVVDIVGAA